MVSKYVLLLLLLSKHSTEKLFFPDSAIALRRLQVPILGSRSIPCPSDSRMPTCEPVQCDEEEATGDLRSVISYGKRRRRRSASLAHDDMLLVQSIQITDKFGFDKDANKTSIGNEAIYLANEGSLCVNVAGLIVAAMVFLSAQLAIIAAWTFIWQRRRLSNKLAQDAMSVSVSIPSQLSSGRSDSLCKLYDAGFPTLADFRCNFLA